MQNKGRRYLAGCFLCLGTQLGLHVTYILSPICQLLSPSTHLTVRAALVFSSWIQLKTLLQVHKQKEVRQMYHVRKHTCSGAPDPEYNSHWHCYQAKCILEPPGHMFLQLHGSMIERWYTYMEVSFKTV